MRFFRNQKALTQQELAAKLNLLGWQASRETVAKIELQHRWVADVELICLSKVLCISIQQLIPGGPALDDVVKTVLAAPNSIPPT